MTKAREPSTYEDAVLRIVDRIGWPAAADAVGKGERVVRNWSDPDMDREPTASEMEALDAAYMSAGGSYPPLATVLMTRLEQRVAPPADTAEIAAAVGLAAKEAGEAIAASVAASLPGADRRQKLIAGKEIDDAIGALQVARTKLGSDGAVH